MCILANLRVIISNMKINFFNITAQKYPNKALWDPLHFREFKNADLKYNNNSKFLSKNTKIRPFWFLS